MSPHGAGAHASAVVVGEAAMLIRGPSGSGKSALALDLVERAIRLGFNAALIGDDRVRVRAAHGRLLARGMEGFEGLIERRGEGLIRIAHAPCGVIRLVVDLAQPEAPPPRMPEETEREIEMLGVSLPRLILDARLSAPEAAIAVLRRLARIAQ